MTTERTHKVDRPIYLDGERVAKPGDVLTHDEAVRYGLVDPPKKAAPKADTTKED